MDLSVLNSTIPQELLDLSAEINSSYTTTDIVLDLISYPLMAILALMIYLEISKIYSISQYQGLKHFKNTFLFFGIGNLSFLTVVISSIMLKFSTTLGIYFFLIVGVPALVLALFGFWIARSELLYTITWRHFDSISTKRVIKALFFIGLMFFVFIDLIIYSLLSEAYGFAVGMVYKCLIFTLILLLIKSNLRSSGRIGSIKHPYYLGLIMLFTLNFLGIFADLIAESSIATIFINGLTITAYIIILKGIRKWSRVLAI
ncbi:hypothetical protein HNV12_04615 [Methanococcoides sp. SA1]|nr:hypothetical protein [Methanococcoides sp. SA1]